MLVLTRKKNQAIVIDERITVWVTKIDGNRVRLGFEGPRDVQIRRAEIPLNVVKRQMRLAEN